MIITIHSFHPNHFLEIPFHKNRKGISSIMSNGKAKLLKLGIDSPVTSNMPFIWRSPCNCIFWIKIFSSFSIINDLLWQHRRRMLSFKMIEHIPICSIIKPCVRSKIERSTHSCDTSLFFWVNCYLKDLLILNCLQKNIMKSHTSKFIK